MENSVQTAMILIPVEEWYELKKQVKEILEKVNATTVQPTTISSEKMIRPDQFMAETDIKQTKFDSLIAQNRIHYVKKSRRIYIPYSEIARYWNDPKIF